jgi:hypothetical protein
MVYTQRHIVVFTLSIFYDQMQLLYGVCKQEGRVAGSEALDLAQPTQSDGSSDGVMAILFFRNQQPVGWLRYGARLFVWLVLAACVAALLVYSPWWSVPLLVKALVVHVGKPLAMASIAGMLYVAELVVLAVVACVSYQKPAAVGQQQSGCKVKLDAEQAVQQAVQQGIRPPPVQVQAKKPPAKYNFSGAGGLSKECQAYMSAIQHWYQDDAAVWKGAKQGELRGKQKKTKFPILLKLYESAIKNAGAYESTITKMNNDFLAQLDRGCEWWCCGFFKTRHRAAWQEFVGEIRNARMQAAEKKEEAVATKTDASTGLAHDGIGGVVGGT